MNSCIIIFIIFPMMFFWAKRAGFLIILPIILLGDKMKLMNKEIENLFFEQIKRKTKEVLIC